jgi:hypothetical protein
MILLAVFVARNARSYQPEKCCGPSSLWCTIDQRSKSERAYENGRRMISARVPQLASIPKTKRQAARQSTHNGSDKVSDERNSWQRAGSRSRNSAYVQVQTRLTLLSLLADFKRLIPFSTKEDSFRKRAGRDCALGVSQWVDLTTF